MPCRREICFTLHNGRRFCLCIPLYYEIELLKKPRPDPPFKIQEFTPEDIHHLQVLATVDAIASVLPAEFGRDIVKAVNVQMQNFQKKLGDAGEIGYHG